MINEYDNQDDNQDEYQDDNQDIVGRTTAEVTAVNLAHAAANSLYLELSEKLSPFVGAKIFGTKSQKLLKNVEDLINDILSSIRSNYEGVYIYRISNYSLLYAIESSIPIISSQDDDDNLYSKYVKYEIVINVVRRNNNGLGDLLERIKDQEILRTDYTVEEILEKKAALFEAEKVVEDAEEVVEAAEEALLPFAKQGWYQKQYIRSM